MTILNESLVFAREPANVQSAFVHTAACRTLLPAGQELYKCTGFDVMPSKSGANLSPWWALVYPWPGTPDPGLDGHIAAARKSGLSMLDYARQVFAVMLSWNSLDVRGLPFARVVHVRLLQPVYGFGGICQRMHEQVPPHRVTGSLNVHLSPLAPPIFGGGAYQFYIPNLTAAHVLIGGVDLLP